MTESNASASARMIFHVPLQLDPSLHSASQIRPMKLQQAFRDIGYSVDVVEGCAAERKRCITAIKRNIRNGVKYDFLYSESSTMPTLLTESHHMPTHPCLDFPFFSFCKRNGIPIGLFYRDIHWCFINKNKDFKQRVAKYFYRYDLSQYVKLLDMLFLPSLEMLQHIPFSFPRKVEELPAGCDIHPINPHVFDGRLRLLYIGGIGGIYDMRTLFRAVSQTTDVSLTVCCRPDDWKAVSSDYTPLMADNINIVHKYGADLDGLYAQADLFAMFFTNDYTQFAVPYKLFDTMGYAMPVFAPSCTWTGSFIEHNRVGVVCDDSVDSVRASLTTLTARPELLASCREKMQAIASSNTWQARARQVADSLTRINK